MTLVRNSITLVTIFYTNFVSFVETWQQNKISSNVSFLTSLDDDHVIYEGSCQSGVRGQRGCRLRGGVDKSFLVVWVVRNINDGGGRGPAQGSAYGTHAAADRWNADGGRGERSRLQRLQRAGIAVVGRHQRIARGGDER